MPRGNITGACSFCSEDDFLRRVAGSPDGVGTARGAKGTRCANLPHLVFFFQILPGSLQRAVTTDLDLDFAFVLSPFDE